MKRMSKIRLPEKWKIPVLLIVSTQLILLDYYFNLTPWFYLDRFILHLLVPLFFIIFIYGEKPCDYGFTVGDWRAGLLFTALAILVAVPLIWLTTRSFPSMSSYYRPQFSAALPLTMVVDMLGWEFLFRGWLLFGLGQRFGTEALWMQAVPFALAHMGKPPVETLTTLFGGYFFGWVAWRTHSFLYPVLIHSGITVTVILISAG
jgi:membrane protease YdiL (CAAX protease family)